METIARLMIVLGLGCVVVMGIASAQSRASVHVPKSAKDASYVMLELTLRQVRKAPDDNVAAIVSLKGQEVGRISLVPGGDQRFQLNITSVVKQMDLAGKSADLEVTLLDRATGEAPKGASLAVAGAQVSAR